MRTPTNPAQFAAFFALATGLAALVGTGCRRPSQAAAPDGKPPVDLVVYTALEDDEIAVYRPAFEASHPAIRLKIIRDSTGIITAKLLAEKENPRADVIWGTALTSLLLCDDVGMLAGYAPRGLERIQERFRDTVHDPPRWVGIKAWMTGFVCNTVECADRGLSYPASFAEIIDPKYRGHVVMPNPASSGTGFLTVSAVLQTMGEQEGWAYLDALDRNIAFYTHSGSKPAKMAGKGEFPIGISFAYRGFKQKAKGEPVTTVFPEEGSGWDLEANALVRKPEIKPEAKVFLDWAIGEPAMRMYSEVYPVVAMDMPVEAPDGYPEDPQGQLIDNDFAWAAKNRARILAEWSRRYEGKSEPR
jgi:iron(III) transport system substrate-binding protein